jgi:hypothetical protein
MHLKLKTCGASLYVLNFLAGSEEGNWNFNERKKAKEGEEGRKKKSKSTEGNPTRKYGSRLGKDFTVCQELVSSLSSSLKFQRNIFKQTKKGLKYRD